MNLQQYVFNSPNNYVDPYGLMARLPRIPPEILRGPGKTGKDICRIGRRAGKTEAEKKVQPPKIDPLKDYPTNPDDWVLPEGWKEIPTGKPNMHRHWEGPNGQWRRWDAGGRPSGKQRGPHWHDSTRGNGDEHIDPTRSLPPTVIYDPFQA